MIQMLSKKNEIEENKMKNWTQRKIGLILVVVLLLTNVVAIAETDYGFLDEMTLEEMVSLQKDIENRIIEAKKEKGAADLTDTGMWEIAYYVDEFRMPTDEAYIRNAEMIVGTFSNSATTNSELLVRFIVDADSLAIILYEYGSSQVKNSYSSKSQDYDVTMMDANGKKHFLTGYIFSDSDRIYFLSGDEEIVLNALKENGTIRFAITESDRKTNSYIFAIEDSSYFGNAYSVFSK